MDIDKIDEIQQSLAPVTRKTPGRVIRVAPRVNLGKRIRTATETIEVPSTQEFRPEITPDQIHNIQKDTEIARLNKVLKQKQDQIAELLGENRQLRKQLDKKNIIASSSSQTTAPVPPTTKPTYAQKVGTKIIDK